MSEHGSFPLTVRVAEKNIPSSVKAVLCWVPWEQRYIGGKYRKVPTSQNPVSFEAALSAGNGVGVIGGCYNGSYLCVVDADDAAEDDSTVAMLKEFHSYTELSPSGKGLRLLFWSQKPFNNLDGSNLEASCTRFFTVTGNKLPWAPEELRDLTDQHPDLLKGLFGYKDADRRSRQLLEWSEPITMSEPDSPQEVWAALMHLAPWRCREYYHWVRVVWALCNGGDQYKGMAVEWSMTCPEKYQEGCVEKYWRASRSERPLTLRSIRWWARQDDPEGYKPTAFHEPLTDLGQGRILARLCDGRATYIPGWSRWVVWNGARWINENESVSTVRAVAHDAIKERMEQRNRSERKFAEKAATMTAADQTNKLKSLKNVWSWLVKTQETKHIDGAIKEAEGMERCRTVHTQLNQHPMLLNCVNATVDLRSNEPKLHDPKDLLTQVCPTEWVPNSTCPRWEKFLLEVFKGDAELIAWVRRFLGYCLTGDVREQVLPVFWGGGSNGKSLLLSTVKFVMGDDYCGVTPPKFFALSRNEQHPTKLASLYGRRLMYDVETGDGMRIDEELIKRATGSDPIACRRMREDFWSFDPTHKLVLATNHEPRVEGVDDAIWRRLKKVPFLQRFRKDGQEEREGDVPADLGLGETLKGEASGILQWMVRGCIEWQNEGLGDVTAIREATNEYRGEQNPLREFLEKYYENFPDGEVAVADLTKQYEVWRLENRKKELSRRAFGLAMVQLGYKKKPPSEKHYLGLRKR